MLPLVTERLAHNVAPLYESIAYMLVKSRYVTCQLQRNARDEFACMAYISTASREEEAGSETLLVEASTGHGARNCRLPRTGQAI